MNQNDLARVYRAFSKNSYPNGVNTFKARWPALRQQHESDVPPLAWTVLDELYTEMAKRLNDAVRESDIVARLGSDEFVVLLPEMDEGT